MCEHTPHEDPITFIHPMPAQLVFGHVTLLNDEEAFLQGLNCGMQFSSEWYHEPQQLSAHVVYTTLLDTLAIKRIPRAWRLGCVIGEVVGLLHPDLEPQDPAHSPLEALAHTCQRRSESETPQQEREGPPCRSLNRSAPRHAHTDRCQRKEESMSPRQGESRITRIFNRVQRVLQEEAEKACPNERVANGALRAFVSVLAENCLTEQERAQVKSVLALHEQCLSASSL